MKKLVVAIALLIMLVTTGCHQYNHYPNCTDESPCDQPVPKEFQIIP